MTERGLHWPIAMAALLLASVAFNVVFIVVASRDASFAVERDYYRKALAWDATMAQDRRNAALGWRLDAGLAGEAGGARVGVRLADREGRPLSGAVVHLEAFHNARAGEVLSMPLAPRAAGEYEGVLPGARPGRWELRLRAEYRDETFTALLTRELVDAR